MAAFVSAPCAAQNLLSPSTVSINGYGSWNYGKTNNDNSYLGATPEGSYRSTEFHLNLAATVNDNLRIVSQVGWVDGPTGSETQVDYGRVSASAARP